MLNSEYWNNKYLQNDFGWDIGSISTPLKTYFDQLTDKNISILIPGAGNAHEAEYLFEKGFTHVHILDYAQEPIQAFKKKHPDFPTEHLHHEDFFNHTGKYDLIIEQTFFCALNPILRNRYASHMSSLLNENGHLVGVLFNDKLNSDHPPFGGNPDEYKLYFDPFFNYHIYEACTNSILPRANREWFIKLSKKIS